MPNLIILSHDADEYRALIEKADIPDLNIVSDYTQAEIVLGEPKVIRDALPRLSQVKWIQAIYAGVEPLVDPSQRHDYVLTNARGVFGELMSEYRIWIPALPGKKNVGAHSGPAVPEWQRTEPGYCAARLSVCSASARSARTWPGRRSTLE